MKNKKLIGLIFAVVAVMFILTACGDAENDKKAGTPDNQNLIVQQGNLEIAGNEEKKDENDEQKLFTVQEVYESGEITRQDLLDMAYNVNRGIIEQNKDQYPEGYVPKTFQPEELDESVAAKIKSNFTINENDIINIRYVGQYGNYVAVIVRIDSPDFDYLTVMEEQIVDEVCFFYSSGNSLKLYKVEDDEKPSEQQGNEIIRIDGYGRVVDRSLIVSFTIEETRKFKNYTVDDFKEVNAVAVSDLTSFTWEYVKKKLAGETVEKEMLVDVENFRRIYMIIISESGAEALLAARAILEQMEGIEGVDFNNVYTIE